MAFTYNPNTAHYLVTKQFYNGFSKVLPKDICEIILEMYFGRVARIRWYNSYIHDHIKHVAHRNFVEKQIIPSNRMYSDDDDDAAEAAAAANRAFIVENMTYLKRQIPKAVNWYHDCRCCQRHQIQKPMFTDEDELTIVTKPEAFYSSEQHNHGCCCKCRHNSRWLARTWMRMINMEKHRESNPSRDFRLYIN